MSSDYLSNQSNTSQLASLEPDGTVPETRMRRGVDVQDLVWRYIYNDRVRSRTRAMVKGLKDGASPYRPAKLKAAGRSDACNVNWRMAEAFLNQAVNAFYDTFSEAKNFMTLPTEFGTDDERIKYSDIMTEEASVTLRQHSGFRYNWSISQSEMVMFGAGPLMFDDKLNPFPRAVQYKDLLVPEMTKSSTAEWECFAVRREYLPHQLYDCIKDPVHAEMVGWNVDACKVAISHAYPRMQTGSAYLQWEYYEQKMKNGSYLYSEQSKVILADHFFFMEFPQPGESYGKITHCIVQERPDAANSDPANMKKRPDEDDGGVRFLYRFEKRFDSWDQVVHPMYYDHGGGGNHHSVTGMGTKMYSAMEYHNRLLCQIADSVFAPKQLFKPTSADAQEVFSIKNIGSFGLLPNNVEAVQAPIQSMIGDSVEFTELVENRISANLSTYRQNLNQPESGNPVTATQVRADVAQQSQLGKTQLDRYYDQMDAVYCEMGHRLCNVNLCNSPTVPGAKEAIDFQNRCIDRGVPKEAFLMLGEIRATRVVGQGSPFARIQALSQCLQFMSRYPETGQAALIEDLTSALVGRDTASRYIAGPMTNMPSEQQVIAWLQVSSMKGGVPAVVSADQNPVVFAQIFLQAGAQSLQSLQQGGNPHEVVAFCTLLGPAIATQLQRFANDPTRTNAYKSLSQQMQQLSKQVQQIEMQLQQAAQKQGQQQAQAAMQQRQTQQPSPEVVKAQSNAQIRQAEAQQRMQTKTAMSRQDMALKDALVKAQILRENEKHQSMMENEQEQEPANAEA